MEELATPNLDTDRKFARSKKRDRTENEKELQKLWDKFTKDIENRGFVVKNLTDISFKDATRSKNDVTGDITLKIGQTKEAKARILKRSLKR